jgi:peptidoglycan hydrolase-like protein with peptidoglycan-binding domain
MNASSAEIRQAQQQLQNQGFYHGQIDRIIGPETEQAIGQFQLKNGLRQTATLDHPTMDKLLGNSVGSQSSSAPAVFHGAGATTNPQPAGSGSNMPKQ